MTQRGRFIALEGIDGAGTTSAGKALVEQLVENGIKAIYTCEPTDGPIGKRIRHHLQNTKHNAVPPMTMTLLFTADRAEHALEINDLLRQGYWVICDRYLFSTLAYQKVSWRQVLGMSSHLPLPDHTFVFEVPVEIAAKRRGKRGEKAEMYEFDAFQQWVARRYHGIATACSYIKHYEDGESGASEGAYRILRRFWAGTTIGHAQPPHKVTCVDWFDPRDQHELTTEEIVDRIYATTVEGTEDLF